MATAIEFAILAKDRASSVFRGVGTEADRSSTKMQKFHAVGRASGVALAGGLTVLAAASVKAGQAAAEDEASHEKMAQTFRKAAGASQYSIDKTESWITAQGKLTGVTDSELRPALSKLVVATHSVTKAQQLAHLAMNVSAGTGKSLESVSFALAKAQNGNVSGLSRLGVATKDASGKTLSLHKITQNLANTYQGAAAKAAQTTAGKQKILTTQMGELQEQIGYKLLPVMMTLVTVGLRVVNWVSHNTTTVGVLVGVLGGLAAVTWTVSAATKAWFAISKVAAVATKAFSAAQWLLNVAMDANPIGLVVIAIAALVAGMVIAYKHSAKFRAIVQGAFHGIQSAASAVAGFFTHQVPAAFNKVKSVASSVLGWVKGNWPKILAVLTGPFGLAVLVIAKNWDRIKAGAGAAVGWIKDKFTGFIDFMRTIPGRLGDMAGKFLDAGKSLGSHIINGLLAGLKALGGFVSGLIGAVKSAINSALNLPLSINIDKGPLHIHQTVIPAFARGTSYAPGGLALVGEEGPELVSLPRGSRVRSAADTRGSLGGDTFEIHIHGLVGDADAVAREVQTALLKLKRQRGGQALGIA